MDIPSSGTALITGASSGIGAVYARRLAARGHDVILVARDTARLQRLARDLTDAHGISAHVVGADLTREADLAVIDDLLRTDRSIALVVNNAGVASTSPLLVSEPATLQRIIDLNVSAMTRLTQAAISGFVARGGGTLINIASIVALAPELLNGVYAASKAYVLALGEALQNELSGSAVRVQTVLPGATATEIWERAGSSIDALPADIVMSVDDLVDAALAGLDAGETVTIPSLPDPAEYAALEAARLAMAPRLSRRVPADRYRKVAS